MGLEHDYPITDVRHLAALEAEDTAPTVRLDTPKITAEKWDAQSREKFRERYPHLGPLSIAFDGNRQLRRVK